MRIAHCAHACTIFCDSWCSCRAVSPRRRARGCGPDCHHHFHGLCRGDAFCRLNFGNYSIRLSVFSDGRFELVGKPFDENFRVASDTICKGEVDAGIAIPNDLNAWRLSGTVWNAAERQSPHHILLVNNASNRIVGLGTGDLRLLDISGSPSRNFPKHDGWAGYVRASPGAAIAVYGVATDGKSACRVTVTRLGSAPAAIDITPPGSAPNVPDTHQ